VALAQRTAEMKQQQLGRLSRYAWRDKPAGIVTIPIDQAMDLVVAQTATMKEPSAP
jgi:hypothetical protein